MPEDYQSYVDRIVDTLLPLTDEQRDRLAALLTTPRPTQPEHPRPAAQRKRHASGEAA